MVTDGVEEGSLGMVTTFSHHDQAKVEPSEAISTLLQQGGEDICQFTLPPLGVFWLLLSGCNHPFSQHINHPIPTGLAVPMQAATFFIHSYHPAM